MKILTIISHTEHYKTTKGTIVGLGSTVTEINHLVTVFDEIRHIAMLHHVDAPTNAIPYTSDKIKFIPLTAVGGTSIRDKLTVVWQAPKVLLMVRKALNQSNYFQFRAPTGIGVFVIPYLMFFRSEKGWFKYAGNWKQEHAPIAYRFQKWLLEKQSRPVTINGFWKDQPEHCLSFENPCLTEEEIETGKLTIASKTFIFPLVFCFVGRLETAKGVDLIIDALASLDLEMRNKIGAIHLVGAGEQMLVYQKQVEDRSLPIVFHGYLSRRDVHEIYKISHAILLPSASEGFPKVIAEAMNYGCIPLVSNVSSIGHYIIDSENGFLIDKLDITGVSKVLKKFIKLSKKDYSNLLPKNEVELNKFSYAYYNSRIKADIL